MDEMLAGRCASSNPSKWLPFCSTASMPLFQFQIGFSEFLGFDSWQYSRRFRVALRAVKPPKSSTGAGTMGKKVAL